MTMRIAFSICCLLTGVIAGLHGPLAQASEQEAVIAPPAALALDGVPAIPASLATGVGRYTEFKPAAFADWHPLRREMLVSRRHRNTTQLYRLAAPGAAPELLTDYPEPVRSASYQPTRGDSYLFRKDTGGNEVYRIYRAEADASPVRPGLPPSRQRTGEFST